MKYNVLVTSIGGDLGKAVCKALRYSIYNIKILGTDCNNYVPYPLFSDYFSIVPRADGKAYTDYLNAIGTSVDLIYICSEQELFYICDNFEDIASEVQLRIVIPSIDIINICRDKYKTIEFLKQNHFPYPYSVLYNASISEEKLIKDFEYPFVVKKTSDCGSKHLHVIEKKQDFKNISDLDSTYMLQQYIYGTEYTNAVYKDAFSGEIYVITFQRTLKDGMSNEVKVIFDKEIENLCSEVARKLDLVGSINIQLRKEDGKPPIIFEINPRYSSTAFMRAEFGFNDVIYAFQNRVLKRAIVSPQIRRGEAYRYVTEYYKFY